MSETAQARDLLSPYCHGAGLDIGCGGDPITATAIRVDMESPYTTVGRYPAQLEGDCRDLFWIRDGALDYVYSSHLVEDFIYEELRECVLPEWYRVLKPGGFLVIWAPDQQAYLAFNAANGISANDERVNQAHKEQDFSQATFCGRCIDPEKWERILKTAPVAEKTPYSWGAVFQKR